MAPGNPRLIPPNPASTTEPSPTDFAAYSVYRPASVASTRYQRIREAALLKTPGATRARVAGIQAEEFLIVGLAAGAVGSVLAACAAYDLLGYLLDTEFELRFLPLILATIGSAAVGVITGWAASRGVLNQKSLEVLCPCGRDA